MGRRCTFLVFDGVQMGMHSGRGELGERIVAIDVSCRLGGVRVVRGAAALARSTGRAGSHKIS